MSIVTKPLLLLCKTWIVTIELFLTAELSLDLPQSPQHNLVMRLLNSEPLSHLLNLRLDQKECQDLRRKALASFITFTY